MLKSAIAKAIAPSYRIIIIVLLFCIYIFLLGKLIQPMRRTIVSLHSCNKLHSYVYPNFVFCQENGLLCQARYGRGVFPSPAINKFGVFSLHRTSQRPFND